MSDRAIFIASPAESNDRWRERLKETASSVARIEIMKASRLALTIVCAFSATLASAQPVMRQSIYPGFASSGLSTWIAGQDSVSGDDLDLQQFVGRWCGHNNNPDELSDMNDVYILRSDHSGQYRRPRGQPGTIRFRWEWSPSNSTSPRDDGSPNPALVTLVGDYDVPQVAFYRHDSPYYDVMWARGPYVLC